MWPSAFVQAGECAGEGPAMNNKRQEALCQRTSSAFVSGTEGFHSVAIGDAETEVVGGEAGVD